MRFPMFDFKSKNHIPSRPIQILKLRQFLTAPLLNPMTEAAGDLFTELIFLARR